MSWYRRRVPPLSLLCIQLLSESPDQLFNVFGEFKLNLPCPLLPPDAPVTQLDPRLWASFVQIYRDTSATFITYPIQLLHTHQSLLQRIPQTPYFSLITLLELPGCTRVTDDFLHHAKYLHSLAALDISGTTVSYIAIKRLAQTLVTDPKGPHAWHGPLPLRILRLRNCRNIDNLIFPFIPKFSLLCVLDLRGTQCIPRPASLSPEWSVSETNSEVFFPWSLSHAVDYLSHSTSFNLWSSQTVFRLLINVIDRIPDIDDQYHEQDSGIPPASFYGDQNNIYSAAAYYTQKNDVHILFPDGVSRQDAFQQLSLYRMPPPWGILAEAILGHAVEGRRRPAKKRQEIVAIKGDKSRREALEKLQEEALRRRQSTRSTMAEESREQKRESRNPFRVSR
ncbi:hypothetical protein AX15_003910 [Amanita polypyramis BW_CC]|nr:hypothetical protein AX15_003910 [Amanita polypyramis BW_CC]